MISIFHRKKIPTVDMKV
jgi:hypothetical protein